MNTWNIYPEQFAPNKFSSRGDITSAFSRYMRQFSRSANFLGEYFRGQAAGKLWISSTWPIILWILWCTHSGSTTLLSYKTGSFSAKVSVRLLPTDIVFRCKQYLQICNTNEIQYKAKKHVQKFMERCEKNMWARPPFVARNYCITWYESLHFCIWNSVTWYKIKCICVHEKIVFITEPQKYNVDILFVIQYRYGICYYLPCLKS